MKRKKNTVFYAFYYLIHIHIYLRRARPDEKRNKEHNV